MKILNKKMAAMLLSVAMILNTTIPAFAQTTEALATESSTTTGASSAPNDESSSTEASSAPNDESSSTEASSAPNDDSASSETSSNPQDGNSVGATITMTAFVPLAPNIEQQTVVVGTLQDQLVLPTELKAITVGENAQPNEITLTGIQWQLSTEYNGEIVAYNPEVEGSYIFTPIIPSGYTLAEGGALPQIAVTVGAVAPVNNLLNNNSITENGITIAATDGGTVAYTNGGFKLNTNGSYQVSGAWNGSITDDDGVRKSVIEVVENVKANITLSDTTIELNDGNVGWGTENKSSALGTTPLEVGDGAVANVTVMGTAKLRGGSGAAGINVHEAGTLNITKESTGTLNVVGGKAAAGIGGDCASNGGTINIAGGTINATGVQNGAAIGGGHANDNSNGIAKHSYGNFQKINITGGTVTATAESDSNGNDGNAAAIGSGCWATGTSGKINIESATVYAKATSNYGATANAIGRGIHDENDKTNIAVTINNSYVEAKTVRTDAACMPGAIITNSLVFQNKIAVINNNCTTSAALTISQDMSIIVSQDTTLTLTGAVTNNGTINVFGTLNVSGSLQNNGVINDINGNFINKSNITGNAVCNCTNINGIVVSSGELNKDYTYDNINDTITVKTNTALTFLGTATKATTVIVAGGVTANITLNNLNISNNNGSEVNWGASPENAGTAAVALESSAKLNLTLSGTNTLQSGVARAGIHVPTGAKLNITQASTGTLNVTGGHAAAGIGGDLFSNGGTINIAGGTINATGGLNGAAIGGGHANDAENRKYGGFTKISIEHAVVNANTQNESNASAIGTGCWSKEKNGTIAITNDSYVYARVHSGYNSECNAIGRGITEVAGSPPITIDNSVVVAHNNKGECAPATVTNGLLYKNDQLSNVFSGTLTSTRSFTIGGRNPLNIPQNSSITLSGNVIATGNINVDGTLTISNGGIFNNYGLINVKGTLDNKGTFTNKDQGKVYNGNVGTVTGITDYIKGLKVGDLTIVGGIIDLDFSVRQQDCDFTQEGVTFKGINSVITILTNESIEISGKTESAQIVIKDKVTANVTLAGVEIDVRKKISDEGNRCALELMGTAKLNLTLKDNTENKCISGQLNAGIGVPQGATLVINGNGALTAIGGRNGSGIGNATRNAEQANAGSITINGGTVTARGFYGIGGGAESGNKGQFFEAHNGAVIIANSIQNQKNINNWNCITLIDEKKTFVVYGDPVTINSKLEIPFNTTLDIKSGTTLTVGSGGTITNNGNIDVEGILTVGSGGTVINNWIVDVTGTLINNGSWTNVGSGEVSKSGSAIVPDNIVTIDSSPVAMECGDITVVSQAAAYNNLYTHKNGVITFIADGTATLSGTANNTNKIVVNAGVTANITLDGLNINLNNGIPFDVTGANVTLTLVDNSKNTLTSEAYNTPALCVNDASTSLTIKGNGELVAKATDYLATAIGSTEHIAGGTITIDGGYITASCVSPALYNPAAIGGGVENSATLVINGGVVKTHGPIGGAEGSSAGAITINGGYVQSDYGIGKNGNGNVPLKVTGGAVVAAKNISDNKIDVDNWNGLVFEKVNDVNVGTLYGNHVTIDESFEIEKTAALTIANGKSVTVPSGVILTNNGTITVESGGAITVQNGGQLINNGTINTSGAITVESGGALDNQNEIVKDTSGTITGAITGKQPRVNSQMEITFALKDTPDVPLKATDIKYGQTVIITANISAATQKISGQEKEGQVTFRRTTVGGENSCELGDVPVTNNTASLEVPLVEFNANPIKWASGLNYTISAELDGSDKFIKSSVTANVTLGEHTALLMPPTLQFKSHSSIKLNPASVTGVIGDVQPTIEYSLGADGTRVSTPEFTGLTPNTSYDIYTHMSGGNCVSGTVSMPVKTEALTLTANTGISATGTYGEPLSKLAFGNCTVTDDQDRVVEGSWSFGQTDADNVYPTVGGEQSYTAQFRPTSNAEWYNNGATLTVEITPTMEYLKDAADGVVDGKTRPNENGWYNKNFDKAEIALDNPSGYSINQNGAINSWYNRVYINLIDGKETKEVYYLHNITTGKIAQKTFTYNCDRALPDISLAYSEHKTFLNWILGITSLKITATVGDKLSGIDKLEYTKTEKGTATTQVVKIDANNKGEIIVKDNFKGTIKFAVTDKAGNKKEIYADQLSNSTPADNGGIITDCTKPQITIVDANGKAFTDRWYQTAPKVYVSVNDQVGDAVSSGIKSVGYTVDTSNFTLYSGNTSEIVSKVSGEYFQSYAGEKEYTITATDNAGNSTSTTIPIKVDSEAPVIVNSTISTVVSDTTATTTFTAEDYGTVYYVYSTTEGGYTVDDIIKQNQTVPLTADDKNKIKLAQLNCNTTYYLHIAAIDKAGNKSGYTSNTKFVTAKSDITGSVSFSNTAPRFGDVITATAQVTTANPGVLTYGWGESTTAQGSTYTVTKEDIGKSISVYVEAANCNKKLRAATEIVTKADGIAPTRGIVNDTKDINTFTFHTVSGTTYEYTTDGWITKNTLTATGDTASIQIGNRNLDADALKVCAKETATHFASAVLSNSIAFTESIEGSVTISGKAEYGEVLTAKAAVQSGATVQYQWYADETKRGTDSTYKLAKDDMGKKITVVIKATGYADTLSSPATDAVAKRQITATAIAKDKTYNGSTDAKVSFTFANTVNNDAVTATATAAFATKEAGANKEVTVSSFALEETWQNYYTCASLTNPTATITQKPITAKKGTLTITKIYDGTTAFTATNAVGSLALEQVHENDAVTAEITDYGNAENVNVGVKTTMLTVRLSGKDANNYKIENTLCVEDAQITQKPLTSQMVQSIPAGTYTGNAQIPQITLIDHDISTAPVSASNYTVKYTHNQNAGTATVTITATGNYSSQLTTNFTINKAPSATSVTAVKDGAGKALATHNDTLLLSANIDGVKNGTKPSGSVQFFMKENDGIYTEIKGAECVEVKEGIATVTLKTPPVGTLSFKAEFTASDHSNYTSSTNISAPYNIDKGEQKGFSIIHVPDQVTYGDCFTVQTDGGSVNNGVTYEITAGNDVVSIHNTSGEVTTLKSGTATIKATKAGDNSFNPIAATATITVEKAAPQIKFAEKKQTVSYIGSAIAIKAPEITLVKNEIYSQSQNGSILYQYRIDQTQEWQKGLPTNVGTYTVRASLDEKGNYLGGISKNITLIIQKVPAQPTAIPSDLQAVTNTQKTLAAVPLPKDEKGTWSWKNEKTPLVADDHNKEQSFKAIFTPSDKENYVTFETELKIKVSKIVATFEKLDLVTITEENGSAEISAKITIIGATLPTESKLELGQILEWNNSAPNIIRVDTNNEGMSYKATVTGLTSGISMVGIRIDGKSAGRVLVKYAPNNQSISNNVARDIDHATNAVNDIVTDLENLTDTEKAVVNSLGDELLRLSPEEKEKLAVDTIESLDRLVEKAQNITTQSKATVEPSVENPIDTKTIEVKGMALASGSTADHKVEVNIKQQAPTQSQDGKQATLEFAMEMIVNGKPQQLESPLLITLQLPRGVDTKDMVIRHTKQDGTTEDITYSSTLSSGHYTTKGSSITMWVNSFSTFTFMIAKNVVPPVTPPISEEITNNENEFWIGVVAKIQSAQKGDVLKIDADACIKMPAYVMEELRIKGVGMIMKWNGGKEIVIPAGKARDAEKNRDFWTLAELAELYKKYSFVIDQNKTSPNTGAETYGYVDNQTGETTPVTGSILEVTLIPHNQSVRFIWMIIAGMLVVTAVTQGMNIWKKKQEQEEE